MKHVREGVISCVLVCCQCRHRTAVLDSSQVARTQLCAPLAVVHVPYHARYHLRGEFVRLNEDWKDEYTVSYMLGEEKNIPVQARGMHTTYFRLTSKRLLILITIHSLNIL